jgi:alpha/beta superfamily hydrolase
MVATLPDPKKLLFIEEVGHFFEGKLSEMRSAMEDWVQQL